MSKLITRIKRSALALCLATPIVSWAATTYSTDYSVTGSETAYTSSAGNANVYWQNFNFRAAVDKDNLEHGYYFFLKDGDDDIGETDAAVKLDSITLTWGGSAGGGIGASDTPYLVVTTADDTPVIIGVSGAGDAFAVNGTSTFPFSNVVLASNAKYRFYFYKNDVSSLSVGTVLTGAQQARINGRWHNTQGDARADYNDIRCSGGTGYSINCSFVVSPLEEGDAVVLETGDASIPLAAADTPVVVEGKVVDGAVDVGSEVAVDGVLTVCGEATTLVLTDSLTATAFYFPATVTIDASAVSGLDPTGDDSSKTTTLLSGALKYMTAPTVVLPAATAGMIYETNVTASGISVTVVKGVDCVETITANTVWSDIKPEGWIDSVVGDKPSIEITYEGEEPVTLTFDEVVTAGTLTLTGNIVVEASAAATFGTVSAGAGSVVEMANMTITTQSGAGAYRYRSNYPSTVPIQSLTYEYVGSNDPENPGTVNLNGMRGVVKTTGYMSITGYYPINTGAKLDVVSGTTTLTAGGQAICGYITIREGATLVNTATDSLAYSSYSSIIDIYGTLDMGTSRWTTWSGAAINLRGGEVVGVGEGNNGALDFMDTCNITAYADSTISGNIKFRNALSNVTVNDGVTLTISGQTKPGYDGGGITKKGNGTLKFTSDPYVPGGIVVEDGTLAFDTESDVDPVVTYTAAVLNSENMDYASASNWKGRIVVSAVEAGTTATQVALNKTGNANSYLTLNGISGDAWCAGSNYTVQPAITLAGDVNFQNGSSNKSVTFRKIAAGTGNLSLKSWYGCSGITYGFTTLDADNYTGTIQLDGSVLTFNVGDILKANAQPGNKVLPLTVANNATVNLANATVNGVAANLELRADGIYLVNTVTVTIPNVPNTTVAVTANGETVTGDNGLYVVPEGSEVVATYTAVEGYELSGTSVYTIDSATEGASVTPTCETAQYIAKIDGGSSYTSLQAAIDATAQTNSKVVLLANEEDGATVPSVNGKSFYLYAGEFTHGTIANAEGNFITTVTEQQVQIGDEDVTATKYRVEAAFMAVTIETVRTLYGQASANDAIAVANAGPLGTTVEFFSGDPASYAAYLPMFTYNEQTGIYTKTLEPVAAVYSGVQQLSVHTTLADAIEAAEAGQTVKLLADDRVSFADVTVDEGVPLGASIVINKNLTIDGNGFTVYGNTNAEILNATGKSTPGYDMVADLVDGSNLLGFFVKSGNVTFTNITLTEFGDTAYVNKFGYTPIQTASAYTGTLTLTNVNFSKFNRTAVCVRGGTLSMTGGTISGGTVNKNNGDYFQQPVEVRGGTATISGVSISGGNDVAGNGGGAIVAWATTTVNNVNINFTGVGIWADTPVVTVTGEDTTVTATTALCSEEDGNIQISVGTFNGALTGCEDDNETTPGAITITGGTFSVDPSAYVASGYKATESAGVWTVAEYVPPSGIDPTADVPTYASTASNEADAEAEAKQNIVAPTGVDAAEYAACFKYEVTGESGAYTVTIVGIADQTETDVGTSALKVLDGTASTVSVPAGLYYKIETFEELGGEAVKTYSDQSNGTAVEVTKPGTTQGFIKVQLGAKSID